MAFGYDASAAKRPVNMSLNEDLVAKARQFTSNLSEQVERMLGCASGADGLNSAPPAARAR